MVSLRGANGRGGLERKRRRVWPEYRVRREVWEPNSLTPRLLMVTWHSPPVVFGVRRAGLILVTVVGEESRNG